MRFSASISRWGAFVSMMMIGLSAPPEADAKRAFLWRVNSDSAVVYILGSIHMARPELHPMNPLIYDALDGADVLALEADLDNVKTAEIENWVLTNGIYPEGESLNRRISEKTLDKAKELGIDLTPFQGVRPWLAALSLQIAKLEEYGFDEKYGVERKLLDEAKKKGKDIFELEGVEYQLNLFFNMTDREQDLFLFSTLAELANMRDMVDRAVAAWKDGDPSIFEDVFFKSYREHPELESLLDKLIFDRNRRMANQIESFLKHGGNYLVVIGGAHLVGPEGVLKRLEDKGYAVDQPE